MTLTTLAGTTTMIGTTMTTDGPEYVEIAVRVDNEFGLVSGENMPNHTASMRGRGKFVMATTPVPFIIRTRQEAYRLMVHLDHLIEQNDLPNEDGNHTYEQVEEAIARLYAE